MHSIRQVMAFLLASLFLINSGLQAALVYEQDVTFGSWKSKEDVKNMVRDFCDAACEDPDIKVISIKYNQKKDKNATYYSAKLICHVSEIDKDLIRIQGKAFRQKLDPVDNSAS